MRIEVHGLTKRYGDFVALSEVAFEVESGERVALVGPNGSGKSTLNRALMGLLGFEGEVRLDGISPRDDRLDAARRIAYVPQTAPALAAPVRELVRVLTRIRNVPADAVADVARRLDLDLEPIARRPLRALSGGMKQKLLISLALSAGASLLILDEPTGSLDAVSRERFFPLLEERARSSTVLLCSHREEDLRGHAERVLELADGRLRYDGSAASFRPRAAALPARADASASSEVPEASRVRA